MTSPRLMDNLNNAVRENPVAAGLIGLGLAWIVLGRSGPVVRQSGVAQGAKRAIDGTLDTAAGFVSGAVDKAQQAASSVSDTLSQGVEAASAGIGEAMDGLKKSKAGPEHKSEFERHFPSPPVSRFADLLDRQPLALAAVGVAVGAAMACAFPSTVVESRIVGSTGETLKESLSKATDTIVDRAGAAIDEAVDEAVAKDLTPEAFRAAVKAGSEKVKTVAESALGSLRK